MTLTMDSFWLKTLFLNENSLTFGGVVSTQFAPTLIKSKESQHGSYDRGDPHHDEEIEFSVEVLLTQLEEEEEDTPETLCTECSGVLQGYVSPAFRFVNKTISGDSSRD